MRVARRHLQATMEESLKKSVAKIEGLLKENARVSSPDFPPRPLRSSVPHAFGRKSITPPPREASSTYLRRQSVPTQVRGFWQATSQRLGGSANAG